MGWVARLACRGYSMARVYCEAMRIYLYALCIYTYMCMNIYIYICYVYIYISIYISMYVYTRCVRSRDSRAAVARWHVSAVKHCICIRIYIYKCVYINTYIHTYTYMYTYICWPDARDFAPGKT